jgi:hypothetical protein
MRADPLPWHQPFGAGVLPRYDAILAVLHELQLWADRVGRIRGMEWLAEGGPSEGRE